MGLGFLCAGSFACSRIAKPKRVVDVNQMEMPPVKQVQVLMKHFLKYAIAVTIMMLVSGCATSQLSGVAVNEPKSLPGWDGVNNLFQDSFFFFGGQPDAAAFQRLSEEAGIQTVVSFRRPEELAKLNFDEPALLETLGIRFINIPVMPDTFSKADVDRLAAVLDKTEGPILLHCSSSNRVGGVWATYLVQHRGVALEEALRLGHAAGLSSDTMVEAVHRVLGEQ